MPIEVKIGSMEKKSLEQIRDILIKINKDEPYSGWDKASYLDLIAFCYNKTLTYLKEHYPKQMFEMLEEKLVCPKSWTKQEKAEFLGIKLEV
ncbi:MAG: hypothetical protein ACFE9S_15625 [Candidatus Hermodarchaeota archaeon]